jgi:hypothetical protein
MAQRAAPPPLAHGRAGIVYLVLDDFGDGCAYRETDAAQADLKSVVADMLSGHLTGAISCLVHCNENF